MIGSYIAERIIDNYVLECERITSKLRSPNSNNLHWKHQRVATEFCQAVFQRACSKVRADFGQLKGEDTQEAEMITRSMFLVTGDEAKYVENGITRISLIHKQEQREADRKKREKAEKTAMSQELDELERVREIRGFGNLDSPGSMELELNGDSSI